MNARRIQKAIKTNYASAKSALKEARESKRYDDNIGYRASLERTAELRGRIADARLSLRLGRPLHAHECRQVRKAA